MIDPEDLAAFHAAVAGSKPLSRPGRIERQAKKPAPVRRHLWEVDKEAAQRQRREAALPAHWQVDNGNSQRIADPEISALRAAMAGVEPLPDVNRVVLGTPRPSARPRQFIADEKAALHESLHGPIALQDRLEGGDEAQHLRIGVAAHVLRDLRRGRWVIQGETDLHGLNRDEARHQLASFLATSLHQGKRCLRVIHGKGHGSPQKLSILRQLVRGWLAQRIEVLAYCQARPQDGGDGALIVLLHAPRKRNGGV